MLKLIFPFSIALVPWCLGALVPRCLGALAAYCPTPALLYSYCTILTSVARNLLPWPLPQFGLLSEPVPPPAMRSLVMIAKCLQVNAPAVLLVL